MNKSQADSKPAKTVWLFLSNGHVGGAFSNRYLAETWIREHSLTGMLSEYPLDVGVYNWAVANDFFTPKRDDQKTGKFIGGFISGAQTHLHYENGEEK